MHVGNIVRWLWKFASRCPTVFDADHKDVEFVRERPAEFVVKLGIAQSISSPMQVEIQRKLFEGLA